MALTQKERDQIPAKHFAVPETEQLPIEDAVHTKMAWRMVDKTKGLSDEQRKSARERILNRAKELGMDTSGWSLQAAPDANDPYPDQGSLNEPKAHINKLKEMTVGGDADKPLEEKTDEEKDQEMEKEQEDHESKDKLNSQSVRFSALSMEIPDKVSDHPNQTPFKGILTRLDEPSNNPLQGSHGKCVILPKSVAEKALSSLLGMAIDFTPDLDGHDVKSKIGIITDATIQGNAIHIAGFFYCADFPEEVKRIQDEKSELGFSYEAQSYLRSMNDDPLVINDCVFTGAAVLYKDKAAYTTTSLSAKKMEFTMTETQEDKFNAMIEKVAALELKLAAAEESKKLSAGSVMHMVKPHTDALRSCAAGMEAAGIGMHDKGGHVAVLHNMADSMEAEAVQGKMPHIYQTGDFYGASADKSQSKSVESDALKEIKASIGDLVTQVSDLKSAQFHGAAEPERKTLTPAVMQLLAKGGISDSFKNDQVMTVAEFDRMVADKTSLSPRTRMQMKMELANSGRLTESTAN